MRHLFRRIGFYLVALWASITITFIIPRLSPINPAEALIARFQGKLRPEALHSLEIAFGVSHDPLWVQYVQYLNQLMHGNLGVSITYSATPVTTVIAQGLPWTLLLATISVVISFAVGTLLGVVVAWRRGSALDTTVPPLLTFFSAVPYFWLALILLYVLGFLLNWFPITGGYDIGVTVGLTPDFIVSAIYHSILPAITLIIGSVAGWVLGMRNAMITTLSEDYVLMAEAKGLPERQVMFGYAARNAILPNVTGFALALGFVVAGQLVTEIVFSYPGIGFRLLQAVANQDYALIQGIFLVIACAVLAANFLADLLYTALDPRVRQGRG